MGRPDGFLWGYPGIQALTVPYHDTNDFFFSGHVGTCFLITLEYRAARWFKMSYATTFVMINQWILMTLVRTHYIIDLITGLIISHYCFIAAEWLSFFIDVKVLGIPGKDRFYKYYKPCKRCGWSNVNASNFVTKEEKAKLKELSGASGYVYATGNQKDSGEEEQWN